MIQFDVRIFFKWVGEKQVFRKKKIYTISSQWRRNGVFSHFFFQLFGGFRTTITNQENPAITTAMECLQLLRAGRQEPALRVSVEAKSQGWWEGNYLEEQARVGFSNEKHARD